LELRKTCGTLWRKLPINPTSKSLAMANSGALFLRYLKVNNNGENTNLSCLEELGIGEVTGLPVVVGQMENYRENPTCPVSRSLAMAKRLGSLLL
jgi:hypothetical protein